MRSSPSQLHKQIQQYYTAKVLQKEACCSPSSCCSSAVTIPSLPFTSLPAEEQPLSFGCGDPLLLAELQPGQVVLDLGSGTGYDCFLAVDKVGESGKVIGIDMTPQMIHQATQTAQRLGLSNIEFRLGYLENLPIDSNSVDVIISNCVINLVPDKYRVLSEAFRVLKPGGKLAITDMVSLHPLPAKLQKDVEAWAACISGAITKDEFQQILSAVGFREVEIALSNPTLATHQGFEDEGKDEITDYSQYVVSARIRARK